MLKHEKLITRLQKLKDEIANTDCTKGLEHFHSNLVLKVCMLKSITEGMAEHLDNYARMMGFGEEYNKVCNQLERLCEFHEKDLKAMETGGRFGDVVLEKPRTVKVKAEIPGRIFGMTLKEIGDKQGGGKVS